MFIVEPYEPKILLISNTTDQEILEFESYDSFFSWLMYNRGGVWGLDFICDRIVNTFKGNFDDTITVSCREKRNSGKEYWGSFPTQHHYIVRDEFGNKMDNAKIANDYQIYRDNVYKERSKKCKFKQRKNRWSDKAFHSFGFREDPVPGTGKVSHWGHCFRKPKTTQERRKSFEHTELIRPKRQFSHLVDSWDDRPFGHGHYSQSWKKFRKTQYKQRNKKGEWVVKNAHKTTNYEPYTEVEIECVECGFIDTINIELKTNTFNYEATDYFVCPKCGCTDYYGGNLV